MIKNNRRFLVLTELFLPTKGGTAVWFDEVYRRLGGKDTHIITAAVPGDAEYDRTHPNTVHRLPLRHLHWMRPSSLGIYLRFFFKALTLGLSHRFEAVHAGRVLPEGWVGWFVARLIRKPLVIYAHGEEITTWSRHPRRLKAMCFAYRHADVVIANSDFTRGELLKLAVPAERIRIIHPGVNLERFHPGYETTDLRQSIGVAESGKLILSVGRLSRRKGFDQVIQSLPSLRQQGLDVHYAIIGIGEDEEYLRRLAQEHGIAERVHLLGHVAMEDLPRWYCAAEVFAMPNREINGDTEGFGMVFVEAAACGTLSVAGLAGGTGAAVLEGETGLRVDGADGSKVAEALYQLLTDTELAERLASQGLERVRRELGWERIAEQTGRLL
jgi:phosphatidylinositol alpha-1,6-mannosyltransferase